MLKSKEIMKVELMLLFKTTYEAAERLHQRKIKEELSGAILNDFAISGMVAFHEMQMEGRVTNDSNLLLETCKRISETFNSLDRALYEIAQRGLPISLLIPKRELEIRVAIDSLTDELYELYRDELYRNTKGN